MLVRKRWIASVLEAARTNQTVMPWARGARRTEMIARRRSAPPPRPRKSRIGA